MSNLISFAAGSVALVAVFVSVSWLTNKVIDAFKTTKN